MRKNRIVQKYSKIVAQICAAFCFGKNTQRTVGGMMRALNFSQSQAAEKRKNKYFKNWHLYCVI